MNAYFPSNSLQKQNIEGETDQTYKEKGIKEVLKNGKKRNNSSYFFDDCISFTTTFFHLIQTYEKQGFLDETIQGVQLTKKI